jgi:hypothetical protein
MARVLDDCGIAAFAEPGPDHSKGPVSQAELESGVLENDIVMEDIWRWARAAGFQRLELTAFPIERLTFTLDSYERFLAGDRKIDEMVLDPIRRHAAATRTFYLYKEAKSVLRSTSGKGLSAKLSVSMPSLTFRSGETIGAEVRIQNTGEATWLPSGQEPGAVNLGYHLRNLLTGEYTLDYGRTVLGPPDASMPPGKSTSVRASIPSPQPGSYELTFDLVSERIAWFGDRTGSQPVTFQIVVE